MGFPMSMLSQDDSQWLPQQMDKISIANQISMGAGPGAIDRRIW
jgi:hypothetical protein